MKRRKGFMSYPLLVLIAVVAMFTIMIAAPAAAAQPSSTPGIVATDSTGNIPIQQTIAGNIASDQASSPPAAATRGATTTSTSSHQAKIAISGMDQADTVKWKGQTDFSQIQNAAQGTPVDEAAPTAASTSDNTGNVDAIQPASDSGAADVTKISAGQTRGAPTYGMWAAGFSGETNTSEVQYAAIYTVAPREMAQADGGKVHAVMAPVVTGSYGEQIPSGAGQAQMTYAGSCGTVAMATQAPYQA